MRRKNTLNWPPGERVHFIQQGNGCLYHSRNCCYITRLCEPEQKHKQINSCRNSIYSTKYPWSRYTLQYERASRMNKSHEKTQTNNDLMLLTNAVCLYPKSDVSSCKHTSEPHCCTDIFLHYYEHTHILVCAESIPHTHPAAVNTRWATICGLIRHSKGSPKNYSVQLF